MFAMLTLETNNKYKHTDIPRYLADALIYLPLSSPAEINITITVDLSSMSHLIFLSFPFCTAEAGH